MSASLDRDRVVYHRGGLVWAVRDGQPAHIDDVPNGLACGCRCEECGGVLIARNQGRVRMPHFAHAAGQDCGNTGEAGLARTAAQLLNASRELLLPPPPLDASWPPRPRRVAIDSAAAVSARGKTPEVDVRARGRTLRLFVRPTDRTPADVAATVASTGVSAVQVEVRPDAAGVITLGTLADALVDPRYPRRWLFNVRATEQATAAARPQPAPPAPQVEERPATGAPGPRFCWRCGAITEFARAEQGLRCTRCGTEFLG